MKASFAFCFLFGLLLNGLFAQDPHFEQYLTAPKSDSEAKADLQLALPRSNQGSPTNAAFLSKTIYGFHPGWRGSSYRSYDYGLMPIVSYYGYIINPLTGEARDLQHWESTALVKLAHQNGSQVELTAVLSGTENINRFFGGKTSAKFIQNIVAAVKEKDADGVCLDFHGLEPIHKDDFAQMVEDLRTALEADVPLAGVSICLPADFKAEAYLFEKINPQVNRYVLKAYGYGSGNQSLPVAPFSGKFSVTQSLDRALNNKVPKGKLLLGLALYGHRWQGQSTSPEFVSFRQFRSSFNHPFEWNKEARSPQFLWTKGNVQNELWIEDSQSLAHKLDLVQNRGIAGVALWALSYDQGYDEINSLLKEYFVDHNRGTPLAIVDSSKTLLLGNDQGATRLRNQYNWVWMLVGCIGLLIILQILKRVMK